MTVDWNWNAVTAAMVKMYEINPNNRELLASAQADVAGLAGDFDYVLRVRLANLITDPINARNLFDLANAQLSMRQFQTALMTNQRLIDLEPRYGGVWTQRAWILLWSGRFPEAFEAIEHESDPEVKLSFATIAHWRQGQSRQSTKDMQRLIQLSGTKHPFDVAEAAGCRGDANAAFEWLDRAFSSRDPGITGIKSDFCLDGLRNDARYRRLVTRVGLDRLIYKSEDLRRLAGSPRSDAKP